MYMRYIRINSYQKPTWRFVQTVASGVAAIKAYLTKGLWKRSDMTVMCYTLMEPSWVWLPIVVLQML